MCIAYILPSLSNLKIPCLSIYGKVKSVARMRTGNEPALSTLYSPTPVPDACLSPKGTPVGCCFSEISIYFKRRIIFEQFFTISFFNLLFICCDFMSTFSMYFEIPLLFIVTHQTLRNT